MESKYKYICKLATKIKKTRNINTNNILESNEQYQSSDIMYLILNILMNNGLLFEKKFSNYDWYMCFKKLVFIMNFLNLVLMEILFYNIFVVFVSQYVICRCIMRFICIYNEF